MYRQLLWLMYNELFWMLGELYWNMLGNMLGVVSRQLFVLLFLLFSYGRLSLYKANGYTDCIVLIRNGNQWNFCWK